MSDSWEQSHANPTNKCRLTWLDEDGNENVAYYPDLKSGQYAKDYLEKGGIKNVKVETKIWTGKIITVEEN